MTQPDRYIDLSSALEARFEDILAVARTAPGEDPSPRKAPAVTVGRSREGRPIQTHRFGQGTTRVSLLAGCHADEPVGPRLLGCLAEYLARLEPDDPLLTEIDWWIVPHINPDGAVRNAPWQHPGAMEYRLSEYLPGRMRELPGDDIEFGFPRDWGDEVRPEPSAVARWWATSLRPFDLHITLHGMSFAAGPWFLIEPAWVDRCAGLMDRCSARTAELGYTLHDVERRGEKGFNRIRPGFATRPDSRAMREYFVQRGDQDTAARFRPSSMEHVRRAGGDPLTLVSEMPLFVLPGVGEELGPPDPRLEAWRTDLEEWTTRLATGAAPEHIEDEARAAGLFAMPVIDQMRLQWALVSAAIATVTATSSG